MNHSSSWLVQKTSVFLRRPPPLALGCLSSAPIPLCSLNILPGPSCAENAQGKWKELTNVRVTLRLTSLEEITGLL